MDYYSWETLADRDEECRWQIGDFRLRGVKTYELTEGRPLERWALGSRGFYQLEAPPVDAPVTLEGIKIVSPGLREFLIAAAPGEVQFLPILLRHAGGRSHVDGFYVANVLGNVDAIDLARTPHRAADADDADADEEIEVLSWKEPIALRRAAIGNRRLFRLHRQSMVTVVRADLMTRLRAAGFTGLGFRKLMV